MDENVLNKPTKEIKPSYRLVKDFTKLYNSSKVYWNEEFVESMACCDCRRDEGDEDNELWKKIKMSVESEEIKSLSNSLEKMEIDDGKIPNTKIQVQEQETNLKSEKIKVIWTDKEEKLLVKLCLSSIKKKWKIISSIIGTKTPSQCNYKYKILSKQGKLNEIKNEENLLENAEALGYFQKKSDVNKLLFDRQYKHDLFKKLKRRKNKNISPIEQAFQNENLVIENPRNHDAPSLSKSKSLKKQTNNSSNLYESKFF